MTRYDLLGQTGVALVVIGVVALAPIVGWCVVGLVRFAREVARTHRATEPERLREVRETRTWIEKWAASRTPEATRARVEARLRGEHR